MDRNKSIDTLARFGKEIANRTDSPSWRNIIAKSIETNPWFDYSDVDFALDRWAENLTEERIAKWLDSYEIPAKKSQNIGIVMSGNLPLVGLHDFLCVLLCGHRAMVKLSSDDPHLLPFMAKILIKISPEWERQIVFTSQLKGADAFIATGSDNTGRYFEYYFSKYPHIIRKNRNSIAILDGTENDLSGLAEDIFRYKGLGCCNVQKLFVPKNYSFDAFRKSAQAFDYLNEHSHYRNNLDYYRAIYAMNNIPVVDLGNLLLVESKELKAPVSVVYYEKGGELDHMGCYDPKLQCVVSNILALENATPLGTAQRPKLSFYMDKIDTIAFLLSL